MYLNLPDKLYYKIGELATAFDVNASLLRFWEKEFNFLNPKKDKTGKRIYTKKDVELLQQIYFLVKEKGHTLEGVKLKMKENKQNVLNEDGFISKNQTIIAKLEKIKNELNQIKNSLHL